MTRQRVCSRNAAGAVNATPDPRSKGDSVEGDGPADGAYSDKADSFTSRAPRSAATCTSAFQARLLGRT